MKVNGDLAQGYLLVRSERDQCAIQIAMIKKCQEKYRQTETTNTEN